MLIFGSNIIVYQNSKYQCFLDQEFKIQPPVFYLHFYFAFFFKNLKTVIYFSGNLKLLVFQVAKASNFLIAKIDLTLSCSFHIIAILLNALCTWRKKKITYFSFLNYNIQIIHMYSL